MEYYINLDENNKFYKLINKKDLLYPKKNKLSHNLEELLYYFDTELLDLMIINDVISYVNIKHRLPIILMMGILFSNLREGNICINLNSGQKHIFHGIYDELYNYACTLFKTFMKYLDAGYYNEIIDFQESNCKKLKPIVLNNTPQYKLLYFQKYYFHEKITKDQIYSFFSEPIKNVSHNTFKLNINSVINEIYSTPLIIRNERNKPIEKDLFQIEAIKNAIFYNFSIISGGPGTGKTSLLTNIIRVLLRTGTNLSSILLGAPTGKSASRISEAIRSNILTIHKPTPIDTKIIKLQGSTLHKILKYDKNKGNFMYGKTCKLPISVLILDEASMIDVILMSQILISLNTSSTKLILLGDRDQLPSVNAGPIFNDIVTKKKIWNNLPTKVTVLKTIYRSTNKLIKLSKKINTGKKVSIKYSKIEDALNMPSDYWAFVSSNNELEENLELWIHNYYEKNNFFKKVKRLKKLIDNPPNSNKYRDNKLKILLNSLFEIVKKAIILTFVRNGITGANEINKYIAEYIIKTAKLSVHDMNKKVFDGAILMITQNDYIKSLFNGDIGIIAGNQFNNEYYAFFSKGDKQLVFPISSLKNWDLAFAITIHKSQGSEFQDVMIILPNNIKCKLLTREALYTGVTRAANKVVIYGSKKIFDYAKNRVLNK